MSESESVSERDCLFCKIVAGEIPSSRVYEDDQVVAFRDIDPKAPVHVLLVPRRHVASLNDAGDDDAGLLGRILLCARTLAAGEGIDGTGYRIVTNCGAQAGQTVDHLHFHLLGGRALSWPPG